MSRADFGSVQSASGFDEWTALKVVTQDSRANIISDIVGHPSGMPSMAELQYMNPSLGRSTIIEHIEILEDAGVVISVAFPPGERPGRDLPHKFYAITDSARDLFDRSNIFDEETWKDAYTQVVKTDDIERYEAVVRPQK